MDQNSDIRLSGRLLATATLICAGFAVATLIPVLRQGDAEDPMDHAAATAGADASLRPAEAQEFVIPPADLSPDNTPAEIVRAVAQDGASSDPIHASASAMPGSSGVYVPVTVHPVTVTMDGSAFAEQLARVASGMDEMLTVQRGFLENHRFAQSSGETRTADWNTPAPHETRLNNIDATLRELTESVESLRSESHLAVNRLAEDLQQAENTTELLREFQRTLAEHRQFLARESDGSTPASPRIARHPAADVEPLLQDVVPVEPDSEIVPWVEPAEVSTPESLEVPLPVAPGNRSPFKLDPATDETTESESTETESAGQAQYDTVSPETPIGIMQPVEVMSVLAESTDEPQAMPELNQSMEPEFDPVLLPADDSLEPLQPIAEVTDADIGPAPESTLESRPVVFEQTVNFVLPPTSDSPAARELTRKTASATSRPQSTLPRKGRPSPSTIASTAKRRAPADRHPVRPASARNTSPNTLRPAAATPLRQLPAQSLARVPAAQTATGHRSQPLRETSHRGSTQPPMPSRKTTVGSTPVPGMTLSTMPPYRRSPSTHRVRRPAHPIQQGVADGVDAVRDFGNDLRDRTTEFFGWAPYRTAAPPRRSAAPTTAHPSQPSTMHRLGSVFRQAGRGRTVE